MMKMQIRKERTVEWTSLILLIIDRRTPTTTNTLAAGPDKMKPAAVAD
jgi:hypothetical protein